jgi:hypothetical protein
LRQRIYQIVAGYEDANDADPCAMIPPCKSSPIRNWESLSVRNRPQPLGNASSASSLVHLNDALLDQFIRLCGQQIRERGEILLDIDSTDDPTHGQQQFSFFNGAYDQHMYHPMLISDNDRESG